MTTGDENQPVLNIKARLHGDDYVKVLHETGEGHEELTDDLAPCGSEVDRRLVS